MHTPHNNYIIIQLMSIMQTNKLFFFYYKSSAFTNKPTKKYAANKKFPTNFHHSFKTNACDTYGNKYVWYIIGTIV